MPSRISSAAISACRSENPSTRSGLSSTILSIFALVNAVTLRLLPPGSRRPHGEAGDADDARFFAQQVEVSVVSSVRHTMRDGKVSP